VHGVFREISFSSGESEFPELNRVSTCIVSSTVSINILLPSRTVSVHSRRYQVPGRAVQMDRSSLRHVATLTVNTRVRVDLMAIHTTYSAIQRCKSGHVAHSLYFCCVMLCISVAYDVMRCVCVCVCHVRGLCQNE